MAKSTEALLAVLEDEDRSKLAAGSPHFSTPMLARDTRRIFTDNLWLFERKFEGLRCIAVRGQGESHLYNQAGECLDKCFPSIHQALEKLPADVVVDGEIVVFEGKRSRYDLLLRHLEGCADGSAEEQLQAPRTSCWFYLFDLLHLGRYDLRRLPLVARKTLLRNMTRYARPLRFTDHRRADGEHLFEVACRKGWEGVVAKRAASPYRCERSGDWLKIKCKQQQELVIGGYTSPGGATDSFGELLIGFFEGPDLRYAGKVGTGFDHQVLDRLKQTLDQYRQSQSPFSDPIGEKNCQWIAPEVVCEVGFTAWTRDQKLRQPRFLGLRRDKNPRDVVRERSGEAA